MKPIKKDLFFSAAALGTLLSAGIFLYQDLKNIGNHSENESTGVVTYSYGKVMRKPSSGIIMDALESGSTFYNNDSIHTRDDSESVIDLKNGIVIETDKNSSLSIFTENNIDYEIGLKRGSLLLKKEKDTPNRAVILFENHKLTVSSGGSFRIAQTGAGLYVNCLKGKANIKSSGGMREIIKAGQVRIVSGRGIEQSLVEAELFPPDNFHRYISDPEETVHFRWDREAGQVEISGDTQFNDALSVYEVNEREMDLRLNPGVYYWRIRARNHQASQFHKLSVLKKENIFIQYPDPEAAYVTSQQNSTVDFAWEKNPLAEYYRLEIATDESFSNKIYDKRIYRTGIMVDLPLDIYYWRLSAIRNQTAVSISEIRLFSIEEGQDTNLLSEMSPPEETERKDQNADPENSRHRIAPVSKLSQIKKELK